ncbi:MULTISPECIES: type II toxin-antitoxin system HicA family toxin [Lysinibacillus]|uniref:type II toxin-antitoxin system HicA family toxin n=1 Tax=Lysinibacillus TaxID=400634 RepID=UPI001E4C8621|nr:MULTISPECIES: type II toxin-antitoxin system HicA family toxin [Lysinibacillus]MED4545783.1 type II toxin-antitoxin system HicA family toxin [Lysinibacillus sphaericus]
MKKVLEHNGYKVVRVAGSHHQFRNGQGLLTTIKRENPVDIQAVKDALNRIGE